MSYKLYQGAVVMEYDARKHVYTVDGRPVPNVTKITGVIDKPALQYWAVNETLAFLGKNWRPKTAYTPAQIKAILADAKTARYRTSEKALNIGKLAHDWLERYVKARTLHYPAPEMPEYKPVRASVQSYLDWEKTRKITYWSSERKVYSRVYHYGGTCDVVLDLEGRTVVADFKTSGGIYPEYFLQVAAYAQAVAEEDAVAIDDVAVIRIPKDEAAVEVGFASNLGFSWRGLLEVFLACLRIYNYLEAAK